MTVQLSFLPQESKKPSMDISRLVEYGIQIERSTHRVHVDLEMRKVYIFRTHDAIQLLPEPIHPTCVSEWEGIKALGGYQLVSWGRYKKAGIATSRGCKLAWKDIPGCKEIIIPEDIDIPDDITGHSQLGKLAFSIAHEMFERHLISIEINIQEVNTHAEQILGIDAISSPVKIQVKCDRWCSRWGLFLQTHEWNPEGLH